MRLHRRKKLLPDESVDSEMSEFMSDTCKKSLKTSDLEKHVSDHRGLYEGKQSASSKYNEHINSETNRQRYVSVKETEELFCYICKRKCKTKALMQRHMSLHQGRGYPCGICKKVFTKIRFLKDHVSLHQGRGFPCHICKKMFTNKANLHRHISLHKEGALACDICKMIFTKKECMEKHMRLHDDGKGFACHICNKVFIKKQRVLNHILRCHGKGFACDIHKKPFTKEVSMQNYMSVHDGKGFSCDVCKKIFTNKANLHRHMSLHRGEEFHCDKCGNVLTTKKQFPCDICKKVFTTKGIMHKHMSVHKMDKLSYCTCKTAFRTRDCQEGYVSFHNVKDFPPDVCKEEAKVQRFVTDHRESSENRTFHCHLCNKYFKMEFMHIHMSIHHELSEEDGFTCECCKRVFMEKTSLWRHLLLRKEMSERRMYFCPHRTCLKSFSNNGKLLHHIKRFHGGKKSNGTCVGHIRDMSSKVVVAASQAGKEKGEWLQEDTENLPASIVATKEYKQRQKGMQPCGENPLTMLVTSPHKYENENEWLKEDKNVLHESMCLESPKSEKEMDETWESVTIETLSLDDLRVKDEVTIAELQNPEAQCQRLSSAFTLFPDIVSSS